ncbi:Hsp20/alpha crystallin family protein [Bacillus marinisedimentorum]|uniref:Hsp20/alpha crystallin family protein n=1 Tax=Bacillus marinisedimentorum TaxID=1821260 RepID=UPI0007DF3B84|nr:Hsp20/alpha crystallin family protein [Bacillus marinisedimentorum]
MDGKEEKFPELRRLANIMDRFFDDPFTEFFGQQGFRADVYDSDDKVVIEAELPGFSKKDINIEIIHYGIKITALRSESSEIKDDAKHYTRRERSRRSVSRTIPVNFPVYPDSLKASYKNGLLLVTIQKPVSAADGKPYIDIE